MPVSKDQYVRFGFLFKDKDGSIVHSTDAEEPIWYIHGYGLILPILERNLEGAEAGQTLTFSVAPDDAFGPHNDQLVMEVSQDQLPEGFTVELEATLIAAMQDGQELPLRVIGIDGDKVTLDGNHPLAGMDLICEAEVFEVREPDEDEWAQFTQYQSNRGGPVTLEFGPDGPTCSPESCGSCCSGCGPDNGNGNDPQGGGSCGC